jgi:hypothetical protein
VALFANLANLRRLLELSRIDMLIMSYGGLRGALAFALALVLNENITPRKKEFITAATVVVLFTVFVQVNESFREAEATHLDSGHYSWSSGETVKRASKTNGRANNECNSDQSSLFQTHHERIR